MKTESISAGQLFKTYTGTKTIKATPMSVEEAKRNGAQITEETIKKNIGSDGYLVEYPDGYRSWSPKKAFKDAYKLSETKVDRMKIELADLNVRIREIVDELYNPHIAFSSESDSSESDHWSLGKQLDAMREYAERLYERIDYMVRSRTVATCDNLAKSPSLPAAEKKEGE